MEDANKDPHDLVGKIKEEFLSKFGKEEFLDEEVNKAIFGILSHGATLKAAELLLQTQDILCD